LGDSNTDQKLQDDCVDDGTFHVLTYGEKTTIIPSNFTVIIPNMWQNFACGAQKNIEDFVTMLW
jgi:hypothetical protein